MDIPVKPFDPLPAKIIKIEVIDNQRGRVLLYFQADKLAYFYIFLGDKHMPLETFENVKS